MKVIQEVYPAILLWYYVGHIAVACGDGFCYTQFASLAQTMHKKDSWKS